MVDSLFRRPYFLKRLRSNPLGRLTEQYVHHFRGLGYSWLTIRGHVQSLEHFGSWLRAKGLGSQAVRSDLVRSFIRDHLPNCHCRPPAPVSLGQVRPALNHLLRLLRQQGALIEIENRRPIDAVVEQYGIHLCRVCGLSDATCEFRIKYARDFLSKRFGQNDPRWSVLRPADVHSYVTNYSRRYGTASIQVVASSLRSLLRYLQYRGWCEASLVAAVPRIANWKLASLPKALTDNQLREFLATFDRCTASGRRDRAMALCQIVLGLRVSEVANLRLEDIDWRNGIVRIAHGKGMRARELPLPSRVGQALQQYLRNGRPSGRCRNVFVRHKGAFGAPVTTALIRGKMRLAYAKVPGCSHLGGTHVLRHTAATRMLQRGASLKEIADVLGHRSLNTTAIYAKVDLPRLTEVALPWLAEQP